MDFASIDSWRSFYQVVSGLIYFCAPSQGYVDSGHSCSTQKSHLQASDLPTFKPDAGDLRV